MSDNRWQILQGDCRELLATLPDASVQCCVTSPPYLGLRDYGNASQIGLEDSPQAFVQALVAVFAQVRRVLRDDGVLLLNLGDSYCSIGHKKSNSGYGTSGLAGGKGQEHSPLRRENNVPGLKHKDLIGIPWRVAFALQADGWWLRQDIIWCLSGGAVVYARTQKGDMPMTVKDLVRLRPETVQLWNGEKWTRVLGWGASDDTSERIELTLRSGERIGCTGAHLWPTQRGDVAARDLVVGDTIKTCTLPEHDDAAAPAYLGEDAAWLAGLYLAEGSRADDTIQLTMHADEAPWLPRIEAVARHFGGSMTHTIDNNNMAVRLYGRVLAAIIDSWIGGRTAIDKHLRAEAWRLPNSHLRAIATGYLDGDGSKDGTRIRLGFCRNYALERDLRTLAARLGATLTLKPGTAKYQAGTRPDFRGEWRWERSGHHNERDRGEVVAIGKSKARKFWDISVEDEPHLFALASGVLTHNCKPNPMPESVTDRCTKAHEYVFLLSKSARYFWDAAAIAEPATVGHKGSLFPTPRKLASNPDIGTKPRVERGTHNRRDVWTIPSQPFDDAHFATMPPELARLCIAAGSRPGDTVLDPFSGAGTTGLVAVQNQRKYIGIELNSEYVAMSNARIREGNRQMSIFEAA